MKKYIFTLACVLSSLTGFAHVAEVNIGDQYNPFYLSFDWYDDAHTMLMTASADVELTVDEKYEKRGDGCMNHVYTAAIKGSSPHRGGATWVLSSNGIPATVEVDGVSYPVVAIGDFSFAFGPGDIQYKFPSSIKYIGKGAFFNSTPQQIDYNNFTEIGDYAFYGNKTNGDVKLTNVEKLGKYAFANCGFSRINIDGKLKEIGEGAFYNIANPSTVSIYVGDDVEVIGDHAFDACTSMGNWGNQVDGHGALYIGKSVKYIGNYAFHEIRTLSQELVIPDATTFIGDYAFCHCYNFCPIVLGKNVEHIGAYAFYKANHMCSNTMEIPSSVKYIGPMAFDFTRHAEGSRKNGITDLNVNSSTPPELGVDENGMTAFGNYDPKATNFWDLDGWWFYPFVCLHVPQGSYADYANHPYWGKFTCIMDDLIPEDPEKDHKDLDDPLTYVIDYLYLVPGETVNLNDVLKQDELMSTELTWNEISAEENGGVLTVDSKGNVEAQSFGSDIAIALRTGNESYDGSNFVPVEGNVTGAVVIFVCPTITLVSDKNGVTDEITTETQNARRRASAMTIDESEGDASSDMSGVKNDNSTYTHRVVYNSYPKLQVNPAPSIEIDVIERAKVDVDDNYVDGTTLEEVAEEQLSSTEGYEGAVVPLNPIIENRYVVVSVALEDNSTTGVNQIEVNDRISVTTFEHLLTINGAAEDSVVRIVNIKGQTVYQGVGKSIELSKGVYIIAVEDVILKAIVR